MNTVHLYFSPPAGLSDPRSIFTVVLFPQVSSSGATSISQPILHLSGDAQAQVGQAQDLNSAGGQTLQSVQLVNPGTFLIQAQTVTATGQIQWQTFQVTCSHPPPHHPRTPSAGFPTVKKLPANSHRFVLGSGRPVTPGTPVAPGTGPGPAVDLSPSPDPPPGPDGPGQPAQPPDGHGELGVAVWGSVRARGGHKQSSW